MTARSPLIELHRNPQEARLPPTNALYPEQQVAACVDLFHLPFKVINASDRLAVRLEDDVSAPESGIRRRARGSDPENHDTGNLWTCRAVRLAEA